MAKRYFEFSEGTSNKFWEIWKEGTQVFTRYGKIGSNGQVTVKDEGSDEKAQKLYDKLVREKTGKGYQEKGGGGAAPAAPAPAAKKAAPAPKEEDEGDEEEDEEKPKKKAAAPAPAPAAAGGGGTRRFEFSEGGSNKFWEITVDGSSHTVRYGKIGTPGQEKSKSFGNPAAAQTDADKLVREKTGKGYVEVAGSGGGGDAGPPAPPLEPKDLDKHFKAIDANPDKPDAYLVFADWLESQGHPWGKLIALHHAIATAPNAKKKDELVREETKLLQAQGAAILGDLARAGRPTRFEWFYGFLTHAVIASPTDKLVLKDRVKTLFSQPCARKLKKLTLHAQPSRFTPHQDWDDSAEEIAEPWNDVMSALAEAPASLEAISFGDPPPDGASAYVALPDVAKLAKALPKLSSLEIQGAGHGDLGKLNFPELKSLDLRLAEANAPDLTAVNEGKLPKLEKLNVWLGGNSYCTLDDLYDPYDNEDGEASYPDSYPASDLDKMEIYDINQSINADAVATFLAGSFPATLKHLGINSAQLRPDMLEAICNGPIIKKLKTLDLSGGTLKDDGAAALVKNKAKLAHLETLDLSRNALTKKGIDEIEKALPNAKCGKQREGGGEPEFFFRYVATME